ncbi:MAG: DNA translocase FtsK 4TM domain-containing protein [Deltaproteobacteria bacterium]|nr:DNA translocase FtsK 4TM domain-containing protein [Deltaproteobacteria bacterium]
MSRSRGDVSEKKVVRRREPRESSGGGEPKKKALPDAPARGGRRHEVWGVVVSATAIFFGLAVASFRDGSWMGPVGEAVIGAFLSVMGLGTYAVVLALAGTAIRLFSGRGFHLGWRGLAASVALVVFFASLFHVALRGETVLGGFLPGGTLGELAGELLRGLFSTPGTYLVCLSAILLTLILWTEFSVILTARRFAAGATVAGQATARGAEKVLDAWRKSKQIVDQADLVSSPEEGPVVFVRKDRASAPPIIPDPAPAAVFRRKERGLVKAASEAAQEAAALEAAPPEAAGEPIPETDPPVVEPPPLEDVVPEIVPPRRRSREKRAEPGVRRLTSGAYNVPAVDLLDMPPDEATVQDRGVLQENARRLVQTLADFGVQGNVVEIRPGPVITMYEFQPAAGTKISKMVGLADDLAMALEALRVRIVAPIPGKNRVGFELPNAVREKVFLRELVSDEAFQKTPMTLPLALGKNIVGDAYYGDLAKMPHLLVAGATGTGKSVGLNAMLASILYRATPDETRLLLIDPKVVELQLYDGIPHLLLPVVTDMKKAALALRWAVDEMERRYQLFAEFAVRDIKSFNKRIDAIRRGEAELPTKHQVSVVARDPDGNEILIPADDEPPEPKIPDRLPNIVLVVDEFADLMMVAAKDVETAIARLAQKARAAGMHLILATQRPSVDVITGVIKANFPSRIAFRVSSKVDSRTILDDNGAEQLLGNGDMLFMPSGASGLERVHGAFVSEDEVKRITDFWKTQGTPVYDEGIIRAREEDAEEKEFEDDVPDDLYDRAVALVSTTRRASTSWVQRKLGIGYNRAAKVMDRLEREGVVGPSRGAKDREILVGPKAA